MCERKKGAIIQYRKNLALALSLIIEEARRIEMRNKLWRKRVIAVLLSVTLAGTGCMPLMGKSVLEVYAETAVVNGLEWQYQTVIRENRLYAEIVGVAGEAIEELAFPSELDGYTVGSIAAGAFQGNTSLKRIVLPGTLYEIGANAFAACGALQKVEFSEQLTELHIGENAFLDCVLLEWTEFPCEIELENGAFKNCSSIDNLTFWENATLSGAVFDGAFVKGEESKKIVFEKDVVMYAEEKQDEMSNKKAPLANCLGITEIEVKGNAFLDCYAFGQDECLEKISFGGSVQSVKKEDLQDIFEGCVNLKTLEFASGDIQLKGKIYSSEMSLENIIFKEDVNLKEVEALCQARNVYFEKDVVILEPTNITADKIYFYHSDINLEEMNRLTLVGIENKTEVTVYGLAKSNIQKYASRANNANFEDVVKSVTVNEDYRRTLFVKAEDELVITEKDLGLLVQAEYYGDINLGSKTLSCQGINIAEDNIDYNKGYILEYGTLKRSGSTQSKNDVCIKYSKQHLRLDGIEIQNRTPIDISVELVTGSTIVAGVPLNKNKILVRAIYEDGEQETIPPAAYVVSQNILVEGNNTVTVEYAGFTKQLHSVIAEERRVVSLEARYTGQGVIVGTDFKIEELHVTANYDNGLKEEQVEITCPNGTVINQLGNNLVTVSYAGITTDVIIPGIVDAVQYITVKYDEPWVAVGGKIDESCVEVTAHLASGKIEEKAPFILENYTVALGKTQIRVCYAGKTGLMNATSGIATMEVEGVALQVTQVKVLPITNCAIVGTVIPQSFFYIEETYNNGAVKKINNPEIQVSAGLIQLGENNLVTVTYQGKEYAINLTGIENGIAYIAAKYIGNAMVITDDISLEEILITVVYKDGSIKNYTADTVLGCMLVDDTNSETRKTVKYFNLEAQVSMSVQETSTPLPLETLTPLETPSILYKTPNPQVPILETVVPQQTQEAPKSTPLQTTAPSSAEPVAIGSVALYSSAKKIKLTEDKKDTYKIYEKKSIDFVFATQNISKLEYQMVQKGKKVKTKNWKVVKENRITLKNNRVESVLYIRYTDNTGNIKLKKTKGFVLDKTKPIVKGVKHKKTYKKPVKLQVLDKLSGIGNVTLNGKKVGSTIKVKKKGTYQLVATDRAGNTVIKKFKVK